LDLRRNEAQNIFNEKFADERGAYNEDTPELARESILLADVSKYI
jgi:hypothetical protein